MKLKATKQSTTGLNTEFVNIDSGRHVSLEHAIKQIEKGNPNYRQYQTVNLPNGMYITMKMYPCSGRTDTVSPGL